MADKKISELPAATTPVAGTEELAIVQSGSTKKVSIFNLYGTIATQDADNINIDGGTIDGVSIGGSSAAAGNFTSLNTSGNVVFNESGADVDFRVESDTLDDALFVDGATGNVGVGTNVPTTKFSIGNGNNQLRHHVYANKNFALGTWYRVARLFKLGSSSGYIGELEFYVATKFGTTGVATGSVKVHLTGRADSVSGVFIDINWAAGNASYAISGVRLASEAGNVYLEIRSNGSFSPATAFNAYACGTYFEPLEFTDASGSTEIKSFLIDGRVISSGQNLNLQSGLNSRINAFVGDDVVASFDTNGLAPAAGKGIDFSADSSAAGMTSELLDDYEEGTWTPTLTTSGTDFDSVTYGSLRGGRYTKVGNLVHIQAYMITDAITVGSASGNVKIGGLPFTSVDSSSGTADGGAPISVSQVNGWAGEMPLEAAIVRDSTTVNLFYRSAVDGASNNTAVADVGVTPSDNTIKIAGTYIAA